MRSYFAAIATAATLCFLPTSGANATPVGTALAIEQALGETNVIEQVRRVCRRDQRTGRQTCWTDRSGPITVCHWIRDRSTGRMRQDCY